MNIPYRRPGGTVLFAVLAAAGVAACGGSSSPHVASLSGSSGSGGHGASGSPTTTLPKGNPTQLLDEWASCMRSHGVPDMPDPTITSSGAVDITLPSDAPNGFFGKGTNNPCDSYLQAASLALNGGKPPQRPDPAKLLKYSQCMQSHGYPEFPDPAPDGSLQISVHPGSTMNPGNPAFQNTAKMCSQKAGVRGLGDPSNAPAGAIIVHGGSGPEGGPGGNGGSGAVSGNVGGAAAGNQSTSGGASTGSAGGA